MRTLFKSIPKCNTFFYKKSTKTSILYEMYNFVTEFKQKRMLISIPG